METLKRFILHVFMMLLALAAGIGASYLLVVKGIKIPAAILGIIGVIGVGIFGYNWVWDPRFWYLPGNIYRPRNFKRH
jgi:hypothetical protein